MITEKSVTFHARLASLRDAMDDYGYDASHHGHDFIAMAGARVDLLDDMREAFTSLLALTREDHQ